MTLNVRNYVVLFVNLGGDFLGTKLFSTNLEKSMGYMGENVKHFTGSPSDDSTEIFSCVLVVLRRENDDTFVKNLTDPINIKPGKLPCVAIRHTRIQHEGFHAQCVYCEGSDKPTRFATKTSLCAPSYTFFEERTLWECHTYSWDARPNKHMIKSYDFSDGDSEKFERKCNCFFVFAIIGWAALLCKHMLISVAGSNRLLLNRARTKEQSRGFGNNLQD